VLVFTELNLQTVLSFWPLFFAPKLNEDTILCLKHRILSSQLLQISYQIAWKPSDCSDCYIYQCFLQNSTSTTQAITKLLSWQGQLLCSTFLPATGPNFPLLQDKCISFTHLRSLFFYAVRQCQQVVTEVLGQPIGPIFRGQDGTGRLSWNYLPTSRNIPEGQRSHLHHGRLLISDF